MAIAAKTVGELGERGLLDIVQSYCLPNTVGDDAAIQSAPRGKLVVTTDVLVESVHFSDRTTPPHAVGWRAAAANLSDLAAMGASPLSLVIAVGLPPETPAAWVTQVYEGITACCKPWNAGLVGGDLSRAQQRFFSITAIGEVQPNRIVRRAAARPGDLLVATGPHGSSRAGLELLLNPDCAPNLAEAEREQAIAAHQYPQPRLDLLPLFPPLWAKGDRVAGMDTSDGLADAIVQVCQLSGVGAAIDPEALPIAPWLQAGFGERGLDFALYGGEDFELLLAMPPVAAKWFLEQARTAAIVGEVRGDRGIILTGYGPLDRAATFQHFQA